MRARIGILITGMTFLALVVACAPASPTPVPILLRIHTWSADDWESASATEQVEVCVHYDSFVEKEYGVSKGKDYWCDAIDRFFAEYGRSFTLWDALFYSCMEIPDCGVP